MSKPTDGTPAAESPPRSPDDRRLEIAPGLLDRHHRKQLGPAWHLYLYLLYRKAFRSAWVANGMPLPLAILAWSEGVDERVIKRWLARLRKYGYISTKIANPGVREGSGVRIRILKAKEWHRGTMRVIKDPPPGDKSVPGAGDKNVPGSCGTRSVRNALRDPPPRI